MDSVRARLIACSALAMFLGGMPQAADDTIRIWKVGSPHRGDTPKATVPSTLLQESTRRGWRIAIETFPAKGFAATFFDAVTRNAAPDLIVFDNFGVMHGITTALGTFEGIGRDSVIRRDLIRVTGAFDELLGPERGWTFLFASSPNHRAARTLAMIDPACAVNQAGRLEGLSEIVPTLVTAYLEGNVVTVQMYADPDRLPTQRAQAETLTVRAVHSCGVWGNEKLAFASVTASYETGAAVGRVPLLLVLRKPSSRWQLLVAARDPISTGAFVVDARTLASLLSTSTQTYAPPLPAMLLSPATNQAPRPHGGERFGTFQWQSSPSSEVVAEIVEFGYQDDARLFLKRPPTPGSQNEISAGQLWTTRSDWNWRVWSITRAGDVAFSEARQFPH
jgi:hypothetical protein